MIWQTQIIDLMQGILLIRRELSHLSGLKVWQSHRVKWDARKNISYMMGVYSSKIYGHTVKISCENHMWASSSLSCAAMISDVQERFLICRNGFRYRSGFWCAGIVSHVGMDSWAETANAVARTVYAVQERFYMCRCGFWCAGMVSDI